MPYSMFLSAVALSALLILAVATTEIVPRSFTLSDSDSLATIRKGEVFTVDLPENPSTGYSWNMTVSDGMEVLDDRYIPPARQVPGRGGYHEWTIRAVKPGQQKVRGIYMRPWEPIRYNETTFRLDLEVTGSLASGAFPDVSGNALGIRNMLGNIGSSGLSTPSLRSTDFVRI